MAGLNPYLNFNGNAEDAFNFYRSVFGGEFSNFQRFKDVPSEVSNVESASQKIMHVALPVKGTTLMGSDIPESYPAATFGNNIFISITTDSEKETEQLFKALAAGGKINMALEKTFWGAYFGMLTDKFGIQWMLNYETK